MSEGYRNISWVLEKTLVKVFFFGVSLGAIAASLGIWIYFLVRA